MQCCRKHPNIPQVTLINFKTNMLINRQSYVILPQNSRQLIHLDRMNTAAIKRTKNITSK